MGKRSHYQSPLSSFLYQPSLKQLFRFLALTSSVHQEIPWECFQCNNLGKSLVLFLITCFSIATLIRYVYRRNVFRHPTLFEILLTTSGIQDKLLPKIYKIMIQVEEVTIKSKDKWELDLQKQFSVEANFLRIAIKEHRYKILC